MKRDVSWGLTAAVAAAAVIGISTQRGGKPDVEPPARPAITEAAPNKVHTAKQAFENGPCTEIEKRLQDFLVAGQTKPLAAPPSCYINNQEQPASAKQKNKVDLQQAAQDLKDEQQEKQNKEALQDKAVHLKFVIATLPDPAHTHFSLLFDRYTEAIQEGASDSDYVYDSSWLPWDTEEAPYALFKDQHSAEDEKMRQEEQPGIILFRSKTSPGQKPDAVFHNGLVVFIVGEEPTQGIHRAQFVNATAWIAALHSPSDATARNPADGIPYHYMLPDGGILGPSFSGSLPSLTSLLEDPELAAQLQANTTRLIYSGTISDENEVTQFSNSAAKYQDHIRFASFQRSDEDALAAYYEYLKGQGVDRQSVAILSEDETAYGASNPSKESAQSEPLRLYYPRGIASLRTAYQKQSIFGSGDSSSPGAGRRTLSSNIADSEGQQHDTIREYNTGQLPQSQEGVLQQIVSQLRAHNSEYVVLRSSNPLDQLFLAHYLRMAYPHGRIVILGADVLLRRESGAARLSGIMTLTTYPLLPWEPQWTLDPAGQRGSSRRVYPQDSAEGVFVTTYFLLHPWLTINVDAPLNVALLKDELLAAGYEQSDKPPHQSIGSFQIMPDPVPGGANSNAPQSYKLSIYPGEENYFSGRPVTITIQVNKDGTGNKTSTVKSIDDAQGHTLPSYDLSFRSNSPFVPTDPSVSEHIPNYAPPYWSLKPETGPRPSRPPSIWLSVLGRNDFWPVAALSSVSKEKSPPQSADKPPPPWLVAHVLWLAQKRFPLWDIDSSPQWPGWKCSSDTWRAFCWPVSATQILQHIFFCWTAKPTGGPAGTAAFERLYIPLSTKIALFALLLWALFHLACSGLSSITSKPNYRAYFVCFPGTGREHRALLTLGSLALASAATTLAFGCGLMGMDVMLPDGAWLCALVVLLLWVLAGTALTINLEREKRLNSTYKPQQQTNPQQPPRTSSLGAFLARAWQELKAFLINIRQIFWRTFKAWFRRIFRLAFKPRHWHILWPEFLARYWPLCTYVLGTLAYYYGLYWCSERLLSPGNRIPLYWRSMNLTNGVSPAVPLIALSIGVYLWVWRSLQGLAFFGPDAPVLPATESLEFPNQLPGTSSSQQQAMLKWLNMFSKERAEEPILRLCKPFSGRAWIVFTIALLSQGVIGFLLDANNEEPIRSLGARSYTQFVCFLISVLIAVMLANAMQLLWIWIKLRQLLVHLDRLPLRRSMAAIRGVSWGSVWKISGNVLDFRYKLLVSLLECETHFRNALQAAKPEECKPWPGDEGYRKLHGPSNAEGTLDSLGVARGEFAAWYGSSWHNESLRNQDKLTALQHNYAAFAGNLMAWVLLPEWLKESEELLPISADAEGKEDPENKEGKSKTKAALAPHIRYAEEMVCYVYLGFIQNILGRMRTLVMGIVSLFIAATISLACYPFDPRTTVNAVMVLLFLILGAVIVVVYAQMHRDSVLSALTNTKSGELDPEFWFKLISFGAGPVLGLLATIFPEMTDFLFSWIAPGVSAIK